MKKTSPASCAVGCLCRNSACWCTSEGCTRTEVCKPVGSQHLGKYKAIVAPLKCAFGWKTRKSYKAPMRTIISMLSCSRFASLCFLLHILRRRDCTNKWAREMRQLQRSIFRDLIKTRSHTLYSALALELCTRRGPGKWPCAPQSSFSISVVLHQWMGITCSSSTIHLKGLSIPFDPPITFGSRFTSPSHTHTPHQGSTISRRIKCS